MRRAFGFQQQHQSYGMRQEAQESSYSMHKEAAWDSKDDYHYHSSHISGVPIVPSLRLDSQFIKRNSMFDGSCMAAAGVPKTQTNTDGRAKSYFPSFLMVLVVL
ncbi:hypothetical protein EV2_012043 [Malus domestica]